MEGLVLLATAFISIAAILWVVVAKLKLASNSSKEEAELASAMTQFDEAGSPEDLLTSAQHPHVTSKWNILEKFGVAVWQVESVFQQTFLICWVMQSW